MGQKKMLMNDKITVWGTCIHNIRDYVTFAFCDYIPWQSPVAADSGSDVLWD